MKCRHGIDYPCDGPDPETGPWKCNEDGSNPDCPNCEPDGWAEVICSDVNHPFPQDVH